MGDSTGPIAAPRTCGASAATIGARAASGAPAASGSAADPSLAGIDLLCHGETRWLFDAVRAPSALVTFLRLFTFGHVRQLDAVADSLLAGSRWRRRSCVA